MKKPCKVYTNDESGGVSQGDREVGDYATYNFHPNVNCYLNTGNTALMNSTIITIIGWEKHKLIGDYIIALIPDIKYCETLGRQCKVTVSVSVTQDFLNPYITNEKEVNLGKVQPDILLSTLQPSITGSSGFTMLSNVEKCATTNLDIYVDIPQNLLTGDYISIRRT